MKSAKRHVLIATGVLAVCGLLAASRADAAPNPGLVQQTTKVATLKPQTWISKPLTGTTYLHVYVNGSPLRQHFVGGCRTSYTNGKLFVWVRIYDCTKPGSHPLTARYLSIAGPLRFTVKITKREPHNPFF